VIRQSGKEQSPPFVRRIAAGLAGLAIGLAGLAIAGLAAAAPAIEVQNPDGVPFPDRLVMNRTEGGATKVTVKDVATARIVNSGDQALHVTGLALTGPFELVTPVALPATVPVGGALEVPVRFIAQEEGADGGRHDGTLTVTSDAAHAPAQVVQLSGFWQIDVGGSNEGTLPEIFSTFGYATTILNPGQKLQNKGKVEAVGDEVLSPFWRRADVTKPVTVRQLGAFHGKTEGSDTFSWYPKDSPGSATLILTQADTDFQTLLPRRAPDLGPGAASFTPSAASPVFGFKLADKWSDPTLNPKPASCVGACGHLVRFWPIKDRAGVPLAGQYLATMDFATATAGNYDYQDNFYLVGNVLPADANADTTAPTLTARQPAPGAGAVAVDANVVAGFSEPMHPASLTPASFTLAPSAGGAPVAATVTPSPGGTTFTLDPSADLAPGTAYTATVTTAADLAGNPLAQGESWSFTTAGTPGPGPSDPGARTGPTTPEPGVKDDPKTAPASKAYCTRYPQLARTLARQLAAARKAKATAATPAARAAAARRIALISRKQRQASARLTFACGARAAYCLRYPELKGTLARRLAAAKKARLKAATPAARAAAAKRITLAAKKQKQAAGRFKATCKT
jgi:hypothetical protein